MQNRPVVSVVVPIHDRTFELSACLASLAKQDFEEPYEIILVLDGSPDETRNRVTSFERDCPVELVVFSYSSPSGNAVRGRNLGIVEARGEFIAFSDSDDFNWPNRLRDSVEFSRKHGVDLVCGRARYTTDGSRVGSPEGLSGLEPITYGSLLLGNPLVTSTVMVRRSVLLEHGGFRVSMRYREDHELWLRLALAGVRFGQVDEVFVDYLLHSGNNELAFLGEDGHWKAMAHESHRRPFSTDDWGV